MFHVKLKVSCTATVISPTSLLSSSSCISSLSNNPQEWVVFAGPPHASPELDMENMQIMIVRDIIHHPQVRHLQHHVSPDVALVSLHEPFTLSPEGVGAACLPSRGEPRHCRVVGWSHDQGGISFYQRVEEMAGSQLVSTARCNSTEGFSGHLPDHTLCVDNIGCQVSHANRKELLFS